MIELSIKVKLFIPKPQTSNLGVNSLIIHILQNMLPQKREKGTNEYRGKERHWEEEWGRGAEGGRR